MTSIISLLFELIMKFRAIIMDYYIDGLNHNYDEGSEWFDDITLKIIMPNKLEGIEIHIFHDKDLMGDSPWNSTGKIIEFDYDKNILDFNKSEIFTSDLKNLKFFD